MTPCARTVIAALALLCAAPSSPAAADAPSRPRESAEDAGAAVLGRLEVPTSARAPAAQAAFIEGMLWLHLFEYERAGERFGHAQALEPDFAMAYWGEAMTHNHPLWDKQDRDRGRAVLARLAPTSESRAERAGSDRERAFLAALEILFGEGSKPARDRWPVWHRTPRTPSTWPRTCSSHWACGRT